VSKAPKKEPAARWAVYLFRKKRERLGSVEAKDIDEAVRKPIEEFQIREAGRRRLSVQREG
jgi:hypothetical protein